MVFMVGLIIALMFWVFFLEWVKAKRDRKVGLIYLELCLSNLLNLQN